MVKNRTQYMVDLKYCSNGKCYGDILMMNCSCVNKKSRIICLCLLLI